MRTHTHSFSGGSHTHAHPYTNCDNDTHTHENKNCDTHTHNYTYRDMYAYLPPVKASHASGQETMVTRSPPSNSTDRRPRPFLQRKYLREISSHNSTGRVYVLLYVLLELSVDRKNDIKFCSASNLRKQFKNIHNQP